MKKTLSLLLLSMLAGCGDDSTAADLASADLSIQSNPDLSMTRDMTQEVMRGPTAIKLAFEPRSLWWDAPTQTLYLTSSSNQIIKWTDDGSLSVVAELQPYAPGTGALGQLVRLTDGSLVVTVFGFGTTGGVVQVKANGTVMPIANLGATRRRIGLALANDGSLYDSWFVGTSTTVTAAGISKLALDGSGETDVVTSGLSNPVGLVISGGQLIVSDQKLNAILQTPLATPGTLTALVATVTAPDLMTVGPAGSLFAGGPSGVYRIASDGTLSDFATGLMPTHGQAYDPDHKRLFVAEPDSKYDVDAGVSAVFHILPVDN